MRIHRYVPDKTKIARGSDGTTIDPVERSQLPSAPRDGRLDTAEVYEDAEYLEDKPGAGGVLTFTFSSPVHLAWVRVVGGVGRATSTGAEPTATKGAYCAADEPHPITQLASVVKVFAPVGTTVSVWGYRL